VRRLLALLALLGFVAGACGGGDPPDAAAPAVDERPSTTSPVDGEIPAPPPTESECQVSEVGVGADETFDPEGLDLGAGRFPSLDDPDMVPGSEADWVDPEEIVLGVTHESGESHAYPVSQMAFFHVANTSVAGEPYLVTY
jgi:hypothetical protein